MSENITKSEESLQNNLNEEKNDQNVNHLNDCKTTHFEDERSDYESCEESSDPTIDSKVIEEVEEILSEEEIERRRVESIELKSEGNKYFRENLFEKSIELYTKALDVCPLQLSNERSVIYANRSAAKIHCNQLNEALEDSNSAIDLNPTYVKALLRRAQIYHQMKDKLDEALKDYQSVLELDPKCAEALVASNELKVEINERNEKLKTEMMSKLKDLGNLVLRPFGLSTDNFKMTQNDQTGGYSLNFQNN